MDFMTLKEKTAHFAKLKKGKGISANIVYKFSVAYKDETYSTRNDILMRLMVLLKIVFGIFSVKSHSPY